MQTMHLPLLDFVDEAKALQLTLSTKGVIVAKIQKHACALAKVVAVQGIVYQVKNNTRDPGVGFSFGNTNLRRTLLKNRLKVAKGPLKKMRSLAFISRKARVFFSGAGYAQSSS